MKKYTLTDEHRAELKPWAERWISNAMSTAAMTDEDRRVCEVAVRELYAAASLPPPKVVVFVPSPFVLRWASGFASAILWRRKNATYATTRYATSDATEAATSAATRDATDVATRDATDVATRDATDVATRAATYGATRDATFVATYDNWFSSECVAPQQLDSVFGLGGFGILCAKGAWRMWGGGNQWSGWSAFLSFFRHVVGLKLDYSKWSAWETLSIHSGPRVVHPEFCMISDRPEILKVDDQRRPHCGDGPFCRWRDGSALYAIHGVRVPWWIIERPERLTVKRIDDESNAEVRRVMIDRYGVERFLVDGNATAIHSDDYGTLYRREVADDEPILMVKVVNSTAEPDGSFKDYFIRVPPNMTTAREAVAWTFDMGADEYDPLFQT